MENTRLDLTSRKMSNNNEQKEGQSIDLQTRIQAKTSEITSYNTFHRTHAALLFCEHYHTRQCRLQFKQPEGKILKLDASWPQQICITVLTMFTVVNCAVK